MEALVLLKIKPDQILQFSHQLATSDYREISRACFLHGSFDCAVEIHAPDRIGLDEVMTHIQNLPGVAEVCACTVLHSWVRAHVEHVY